MTPAQITGLIELACPDLTAAIMADGEGKRPSKPYATFKIGSSIGQGHPIRVYQDSVDYPTEKVTETVQRVKTPKVEINFYSDTETQILKKQKANKEVVDRVARDFCENFLERLYLVAVQDYMTDAGFSLLETTDFSDVGVYLGDKHERRAICELTFNEVTEQAADIPFIGEQDDYGITGTYYDAAGSTI